MSRIDPWQNSTSRFSDSNGYGSGGTLPPPAYARMGKSRGSSSKLNRRGVSCVRYWRQFTTFQKVIFGVACVTVLVMLAGSKADDASIRNQRSIPQYANKEDIESLHAAIDKLRTQNSQLKTALSHAASNGDAGGQFVGNVDKVEQVEAPGGMTDDAHRGDVVSPPPSTPSPTPMPTHAAPPPPVHDATKRHAENGGMMGGVLNKAHTGPKNPKQQAVVDTFKWAWKGYKDYAWGKDELKPISKRSDTWFNLGLTLVDSVDTILLMGLEEEYLEAREWVAHDMVLDQDKDVNLFECTIRVLGGLLSSYTLSGDHMFLERATDLGDRLMHAFKSASKVPFSDVNLGTHNAHKPAWGPDSSTSEVTTIQLEFRELSRLTGDDKYKNAVDEVMEHVRAQPKTDGLVPIWINANSGKLKGSHITLGARGDSYYEYLLKQWLQSGKTDQRWKDMYMECIDGIFKHMVRGSKPSNLTFLGEFINGRTNNKMDHLVCFMPGLLALGYANGMPRAHMDLAVDVAEACNAMYTHMKLGLAPEITFFNEGGGTEDLVVKPADSHNLLRPEHVESLFVLHRITGDAKYVAWGWDIYQNFEKHCRIPTGGYSSLRSVLSDHPEYRDKMESFFLGETLKYLFLLFESPTDRLLPLDEFVFNTEAHPLPIFKGN
eukprot:m.1093250 g.1093250  ORF g.1093250 m.1093250 type:complete len:660 (-) comp24295_c0_seq4:2274-4253(-)